MARADVVTTTTWTFDTPSSLTSGDSSILPFGMEWSDGAYHSNNPAADGAFLAFVNGATEASSKATLISIDPQYTGDKPFLVGVAAGAELTGQLDENRWLMQPSASTYRVVLNVPDSISGLTITRTNLSNPKAGDVNFDGLVNIFDVNMVSSHWGIGPVGDANYDRAVNVFDVNTIADHWNSSSAVVDEPDSLTLVCTALCCLRLLLLGRGGALVTRRTWTHVG